MSDTPMKIGITCYPSVGGSGILANCIAIAVVLRIDWESRQLQRGLPA